MIFIDGGDCWNYGIPKRNTATCRMIAGKVIVASLASRQMLKVYAGVASPDKFKSPCANAEVLKVDMEIKIS